MPFYIFINSIKVINFWNLCENILGFTRKATPELKANANFMQLQSELSDTENKIALSRQFYNDTVLKYNNAIQMFPASFIAGLCGFHPMSFWNAEEEARERITIQAEDMKFS